MASRDDIINNPNFGKMYRNNPQFKKLADRLLADPSGRQSSIFNRVKIAVDSGNNVSFDAGPAGMFKDLREAVIQSWAGWRTSKETTADRAAFTGPYHNELARFLASTGENI